MILGRPLPRSGYMALSRRYPFGIRDVCFFLGMASADSPFGEYVVQNGAERRRAYRAQRA